MFPHLAGLKRRGGTTKDIFLQTDPFNEREGNQSPKNSSSAHQTHNEIERQVSNMLVGDSNKDNSKYVTLSREKPFVDNRSEELVENSVANSSNRFYNQSAGTSQENLGRDKSYNIPTIKLLNPDLYKELEKKGR